MTSIRGFAIACLFLFLEGSCQNSVGGASGGTGGHAGGAATGGQVGGGGTNAGTGGTTGIGGTATGGSSAGNGGRGGASAVGGSAGGIVAVTGGTTGTGGSTSGGATGGSIGLGGGTFGGGGKSTGSGGMATGGGVAGAGGRGGATGGTTGVGGVGGAGTPDGGVTNGAVYVSPGGDDSNPGTLAEPVKTLAKAQDLVRALNGTMTSDITVYLRAGTYPLTSTVTFANPDSGKNGFYVKYMAYPGERPLITGGLPITGWKVSDATNGIYSASGITSSFRQLYVNGVKAIRARSPNLGANGAANFNRISGFDKTAHNVQVASSYVSNWNNLTKVEMHYMINWTDNVLRLASYTTSGSTANLKFQSAEDAILYARPYPQLGMTTTGKQQCFYFENALEFLDQPGEWYLDETAKVLYYKPRTGEDMTTATVVAPMVETLLAVNGTSTSDQAAYLWFQGLTFAHSTYLRPSQYGFLDGQAGQYNVAATTDNKQYVGRPAAGVSVTNANHLHFERNMFAQMAATGLDFISGTHDDLIIGNVFTDIGGNGVSVGKFVADETTEFHVAYNPTDKNEICTNDTIKDNYINNVTTEIQGACGIACGYPKQIDIEHNEVAVANYTGISVGFGWTATANAMTGNKINYNNIHNISNILADGSAIYTLSNQGTGSQIEYNYIHDFSQATWADYQIGGLYLDEQTSGYTVSNNVSVNAPTSILQNKNGSNSVSALLTSGSSIISAAGIEAAYADIKTMTMPVPVF
jgi:hypothetical protein